MKKTLIMIPILFLFTYALDLSISDMNSLRIGKAQHSLCEGLQKLTSEIEQRENNSMICIGDSSKTFDQLWTAMNIIGNMQKKNISVSYKNKLYLFPKADANYSDDSLNHTVILTDEILLEGTSKGWGKNISRKKIGTRTLDEFINSMKETVTAIGREPKNSNLNIGFRKKEDLETVFFIIDRISEKGWKHIYLALTRESSTDVDSSSCLTTLMSELVYEPKMKKAGLVGGRKKEDIANIVNEHLSALRFHYHEWLKDNKKKTGKITVKMTINSSGRVVEAQIFNNTFNDEDFEHIVLKEIREWRFGKMDNKDDKTEIVYPFVFEE